LSYEDEGLDLLLDEENLFFHDGDDELWDDSLDHGEV
jgi:hypothetical protein